MCGVHLPSGESLLTDPLSEEDAPASEAGSWSLGVGEPESATLPLAATSLHILVVESERRERYSLPLGEIWVGRCDAPKGITPDLDLAPDGGYLEGVSRRHARVYQEDDLIFVEDAASTNGTFLNDRRLVPRLPYPLREGDALRLGKLNLLVRFGNDSRER